MGGTMNNILFLLCIFSISFTDVASATPDSIFAQLQSPPVKLNSAAIIDLEIARANWHTNHDLSLVALTEFVSQNDHLGTRKGKAILDGLNEQDLLSLAIDTSPSLTAELFVQYLASMTVIIDKVASAPVPEGSIRTFWNYVNDLESDLLFADERMKAALTSLASTLLSANPSALHQFRNGRPYLSFLFSRYLDARSQRYSTVNNWVDEIEETMTYFINHGQLVPADHDSFETAKQRIQQIITEEVDIQQFRLWTRSDVITTGAVSILLAAEAVCTFLTYGICAPTIPLTASLLVRGGNLALKTTRVVVAGNAAANIVDRYRAEGTHGLMNIGTVIDTLLIFSLFPSPSLQMLNSAQTIKLFGRSIPLSGIAVRLAAAQHKATYLLGSIAGVYGAYQLANAEAIVKKMHDRGSEISVDEIRTQGAVNLALGLLGGLSAYRGYRNNLKENPAYQAYQSTKAGALATYKQSILRLYPMTALRKLYAGMTAIRSKSLWIGSQKIAHGAALLGYQAVVSGVYALLSYTYPDFIMRKNNVPLPELASDEFALLLNGFASNDLLYFAFSSRYANRHETQKYNSEGKLVTDYFNSAEDFVLKIKAAAEKNGKIKYLKIMAHGIPGRIVPVATNITGDQGYQMLDADYLMQNLDWIKEIAQDAFAPDAQIVIISCLVGGNLESDTEHNGIQMESKSGDNFINALGQTLLPNGGSIDSSRRIILGLDGSVGPLWDEFLHGSIKKQDLDRSIQSIATELAAIEAIKQPLFDEKATPDMAELSRGTATRLIKIWLNVWNYVVKFGVNMEGGLFDDRHRSDHFSMSE